MDKMILVITVRREVPDKATAKNIVDVVKSKLADHPEFTLTSQTTERFDVPED